ncbi:hypothetical protein CDAR_277591 [Caerostris darwini]|uniref:Uncharacterized protein n=1 Tax=Caerostris darwini TaxID=1538125 RepID=A0AAV4VR34_9ARAC|nr:hypothetical protein CDAR_277591 [Caerostris darwini]
MSPSAACFVRIPTEDLSDLGCGNSQQLPKRWELSFHSRIFFRHCRKRLLFSAVAVCMMELPITGNRLGFRLERPKIRKQHDAAGRRKNFFFFLWSEFQDGPKGFSVPSQKECKRGGRGLDGNYTSKKVFLLSNLLYSLVFPFIKLRNG